MQITLIKQQKNSSVRYAIFIDDEYRLSLNADELIRSGISKGDTVTDHQLAALMDLDADARLMQSCIAKLSRRLHSTGEIRLFLKKKQADEAQMSKIIGRLSDNGYLNDEEYASVFARQRLLKGDSAVRIKQRLRAKGVGQDVVDSLKVNADSELNSLQDLIKKKRRQSSYNDEKKLIRYLMSKGFRYAEIKSAIEQVG